MRHIILLAFVLLAGCAHCQRWEYRSEWATSSDILYGNGVQKLDREGAEGWELTAVERDPNNPEALLFMFKRPN